VKTRHFVTVWNPGYSSTSMEAHLDMLLGWVRSFRDDSDKTPEDDVYVWWGKVRSAHRQRPLEHLPDILGATTAADSEEEQHLYLTDYRSLYVGLVAEITDQDPRADDAAHVPAYYTDRAMNSDCWFKLWDIRRLVADDTVAVVDALARLRNTRYSDQPVSLYGGMVDMPLIVTREPAVELFGDESRDLVTGGTPWVQFDAERSGTAAMEKELRDNVLGDAAWRRLDPAARTFLATAESIFRRNREDPGFDFSPVVIDFAKAMEVQASLTLATLVSRAPVSAHRVLVDGKQVDLTKGGLSIGQLAWALREGVIHRAIKQLGPRYDWIATSLSPVLSELKDVRNPAAHQGRVSLEVALNMRNKLLGVGCEGSLVRLTSALAR